MTLVKNRVISSLKVNFPLSTQSMANYSITSLKSFLTSNHDFSTGKGPEIRDWASGGHSMFLKKGDVITQVNSPKQDPSKLSVAFMASSISKNMENLVVCETLNEQGENYYVLMDKAEFAPDTQTTAAEWGF